MTMQELAARDYKRAKINYLRAKDSKCTPPEELQHLEEIMELRRKMAKRLAGPRRIDKYQGFDRTLSAAGWAKELGLPRNTVWRYLKNGMTPEQVAAVRDIKYP